MRALPERLEAAAAAVATTAIRFKNKFLMMREMEAAARKCRNPGLRKNFRKTRHARRGFDARMEAFPKGKPIQRPVAKRLWINEKASEDRREWMEDGRGWLRKMQR